MILHDTEGTAGRARRGTAPRRRAQRAAAAAGPRQGHLPAALPLRVLHHGAGPAAQLRVQPLLHLHEEAVHVHQGHHALPPPGHPRTGGSAASRPTGTAPPSAAASRGRAGPCAGRAGSGGSAARPGRWAALAPRPCAACAEPPPCRACAAARPPPPSPVGGRWRGAAAAAAAAAMSAEQVSGLCEQLVKAVTVIMDPASTQRYRLEALKVPGRGRVATGSGHAGVPATRVSRPHGPGVCLGPADELGMVRARQPPRHCEPLAGRGGRWGLRLRASEGPGSSPRRALPEPAAVPPLFPTASPRPLPAAVV